MKYNIELLKADILEELSNIRRLEKEFSLSEDKLDKSSDEVPFYDRAAIGYFLHGFYNGCENIFQSVARFFENDVGPQTWHRDLLKRMKLHIPGYRPALIDQALFTILDEFRGFRHVYRHSYTFQLDWEKEVLVARKFKTACELFHEQVTDFLEKLDQLEQKRDEFE